MNPIRNHRKKSSGGKATLPPEGGKVALPPSNKGEQEIFRDDKLDSKWSKSIILGSLIESVIEHNDFLMKTNSTTGAMTGPTTNSMNDSM